MRFLSRISITLMAVLTLCAELEVQAAMLKGLVLADELGGPPVAGVEIVTTDGEARAVTDAGGSFTLLFPDRHAGDNVKLTARKEGREVINDIQLEHSLGEEFEGGPLVLLLCREGNREEMARRLVLLMAVKAIDESYGRRLKELEEQKENALAGLPDLRRRLYQADDALATIPRTLARRNGDRSSGLYRQAMRFFLEGKIERALGIFEKRETDRSQEGTIQITNSGKENSEEISLDYQVRAQFLTLALQFNEAVVSGLGMVQNV